MNHMTIWRAALRRNERALEMDIPRLRLRTRPVDRSYWMHAMAGRRDTVAVVANILDDLAHDAEIAARLLHRRHLQRPKRSPLSPAAKPKSGEGR